MMGTPVASSALSTVATALPLWLTQTVALRQFAAIIAISLSLSFVYALFMLVPLLAMLGPNKPKALTDTDAPGIVAMVRKAFSSVSARAGLACALCLAIMVRASRLFVCEALRPSTGGFLCGGGVHSFRVLVVLDCVLALAMWRVVLTDAHACS